MRGTTSPNPPVGAVILDANGQVAGVGATAPPGGPHAEVRRPGRGRRPGTRRHRRGHPRAVQPHRTHRTLRPRAHRRRSRDGVLLRRRTPIRWPGAEPRPCGRRGSRCIRDSGRRRDPRPAAGLAAPAAHRPPARHVEVRGDARRPERRRRTEPASGSPDRRRGHGCTPSAARLDAIVVGTGTVLADDPWLTARLPDGDLAPHQPLRVVVGMREIPTSARVLDDAAPTLVLRTRDIGDVLDALTDHPDVLLEGGPRLAGAFLAARSVDRIQAYLAPMFLGAGTPRCAGRRRTHHHRGATVSSGARRHRRRRRVVDPGPGTGSVNPVPERDL